MLHSHLKTASKGLNRKKTTTKCVMKPFSVKSEIDQLAVDLALEWCSGSDIFHQQRYVE